jgi:signal transduction histidine kinase
MTAGWGEFIPRLVHDAKALLRKPHYKTQLLERRIGASADPETKALLEGILCGHTELSRLLIRAGALAAALQPSAFSTLPLRAVVLALQAASKDALAEAGARWQFPEPPDWGVPSRLQIALQELVDNSLRFRAPERSPQIWLQYAFEDGTLKLDYRDNGAGWDPAYTHKLFVPFERLDAQRSGFGLGLAIARATVEGCGGSIRAATSPCGAQFVIELPISPSAEDR